MKNHVTKRVLALCLTMVMVLSVLAGVAPIAQADTGYTTGTAAVYDLYDLSFLEARDNDADKTYKNGAHAHQADKQVGIIHEIQSLPF